PSGEPRVRMCRTKGLADAFGGPFGNIGQPAVHLAAAQNVTGKAIKVDGGITKWSTKALFQVSRATPPRKPHRRWNVARQKHTRSHSGCGRTESHGSLTRPDASSSTRVLLAL